MTLRLLALITSTSLLISCASFQTSEHPDSQQPDQLQPTDTSAQAEAEEVYRPIPADTLYSLLVAEVAGQRQRFDISLYHYMNQARKTQDADISERATRIAQYVGSAELAEEAIEIWLNSKPEDPAAHQAAAQLAMDSGDFDDALNHLEKLLQLAQISQFDYLAANASRQPEDSKRHILKNLEVLSGKYPQNANLFQARAIIEQQLGMYDQALTHTNHAVSLQQNYLSAKIQKARLLAQMQRVDDAIEWLDELEQDKPDHKGIAVLKARLLLQQRRMDEALQAFTDLNDNFPDDMAILLSLALLEEELGDSETAKTHLLQLLDSNSHESEANFYLGKIALESGDNEKALGYYRQVKGGREFLAAHLQAAELIDELQGLSAARDYLNELRGAYPRQTTPLIRIEVQLLTNADEKEQAMELLTQALSISPKDYDLLYTRAMLAEQLDNLELLESDLRFLISLKPDHAEALNALGYTLADRTDRWDEALPLVEKALSLSPNNPAIIDSLGWIYFRSGDFDRALPLLKQAFEILVDHEIAAHYGEILWITGDKNQARTVWQQGLDTKPDSKIIQRTLERLNVDNPPQAQSE